MLPCGGNRIAQHRKGPLFARRAAATSSFESLFRKPERSRQACLAVLCIGRFIAAV
jgi:hypothetical protein